MEQRNIPDVLRTKKHLMLRQQEKTLSDGSSGMQIVMGSRVKLFPVGFSGKEEIPYLPPGKLAELVAMKNHYKCHVDIDTIVCHIRNQVFVPNLRKIVSKIDKNCVY